MKALEFLNIFINLCCNVQEQLVLALGYTTSLLVLDTSLRLPDPRSRQVRSVAYDVVAGREKEAST